LLGLHADKKVLLKEKIFFAGLREYDYIEGAGQKRKALPVKGPGGP
jgi:hypothetical protein